MVDRHDNDLTDFMYSNPFHPCLFPFLNHKNAAILLFIFFLSENGMESHFPFFSWESCNAEKGWNNRHRYGVIQIVPSYAKITGTTRITRVTQYTYSMPNYTSQRPCGRKLRKQNLRAKIDLTSGEFFIKD